MDQPSSLTVQKEFTPGWVASQWEPRRIQVSVSGGGRGRRVRPFPRGQSTLWLWRATPLPPEGLRSEGRAMPQPLPLLGLKDTAALSSAGNWPWNLGIHFFFGTAIRPSLHSLHLSSRPNQGHGTSRSGNQHSLHPCTEQM